MDDLDTLRGLRAGVATPSADQLGEQRQRLLAEASRAPRRWSWLRRRWRHPHRTWIPALAGGLTLALLVGVLGVVLTQRGHPALSPPESDQWLYSHTVTSVDRQLSEDERENETFEREGWVRADLQQTASRGEDGELTRSAGEWLGPFFDDGQDLYEFYQSLLDDPDSRLETINEQITDQVERTVEGGGWSEDRARTFLTLELVRTVLTQAAPPPDVQTALYEALREHPDFDDDGTVPDASGRDSIALGTQMPSLLQEADSETRQQFLFHPDTHTFHGWRTENQPHQVSSVAVLSTGIVDQPGQTP